MAKNERQRQQNLAKAQQGLTTVPATGAQIDRKREIDRTLATTRTSTGSMGKFDRVLDGEKKLRGVKRKVPPTFLLTPYACSLLFFAPVPSLTRLKSPSTQRGTRILLSSNKLETACLAARH